MSDFPYMSEVAMAVLRQIDRRGTVVLPKEMRSGVDLVEIERRPDGVIELRPRVAVDASQAWFWSDRWQRMEREADLDIAEGRERQLDNVDDLIDDLESGA